MADIFKLQEAITFVQQTPPETFRLMDVTISNLPLGYNHGKVSVVAATVDQEIATDVNIFVMNCATGVSVKFGNTTADTILNVTHLSYKGAKTSIFVSNTGTEDIDISYATCIL